jgi:endonuclease/exonuclease/phosphatase (EEP) superfamily protein YafD
MLLSAGLFIVTCHLTWVTPDFVRDRRGDPPFQPPVSNASPTLRVFFANVMGSNKEHAALLDEIAQSNPEVVVLVEFGWWWHVAFTKSEVMAPYKYGSGWTQADLGSVSLFSKLPLRMEQQEWFEGRAVHTADIELGAKTLRLVGLHAPRPTGPPQPDYFAYWQQVAPKLLGEKGPVLVVGDFNATEHSRVYRDLTQGRFRSAHEDRGRGWASTWPNGKYPLPPIRIDQAFVSRQVECLRIVEGEGRGSDHKPLVVDVRIRDRSSATPMTTDD